MEQHERGEGANFTWKHLPVKLVYQEEFFDINDAYKREKQIQKWTRAKKEALIAGDIEKLIALSKNHTEHKKGGFKKSGPFASPKNLDDAADEV